MSETFTTRGRRPLVAPIAGAACLTVAAGAARAAVTLNITNDTYVDSYQAEAGVPGEDNTRINYGSNAAIKVVTSAGSTSFPDAESLTHSLFTLPAAFWSDIGSANVSSAVVTYAARNNQLAGRNVELHPLTHGFVAGTGGSPSSTMGGTNNSSGSPVGADWYTYDGANAWATPGGDYDAADFVTQTTSTVGSLQYFSWDITALVDNPTTRADLMNDGILLKAASEDDYPNPQQFISFYSADAAAYNNSTAEQPTVTFTVAGVPEPTTAGLVVAAGSAVTLGRRRRRQSRVAP